VIGRRALTLPSPLAANDMMRGVRRVILLTLPVVVAAGGVIATAPASGGSPITRTDALAFIRAVNLQPSDLPGSFPFQGEPGTPPDTAETQHGALRCRGKARGVAVAAGGEPLVIPYFHGSKLAGEELYASLVIVMPSDALANAEIAALRSRGGRRCVAHDLSKEPGPPSYAVAIRFVPVARLLGREALFLRVVERLRKSRPPSSRPPPLRHLPPPPRLIYKAEAVFRVGAAVILFLTESERRQLPAASEIRLLSLLHSRAMAHRL
jgi:hypothetical protein